MSSNSTNREAREARAYSRNTAVGTLFLIMIGLLVAIGIWRFWPSSAPPVVAEAPAPTTPPAPVADDPKQTPPPLPEPERTGQGLCAREKELTGGQYYFYGTTGGNSKKAIGGKWCSTPLKGNVPPPRQLETAIKALTGYNKHLEMLVEGRSRKWDLKSYYPPHQEVVVQGPADIELTLDNPLIIWLPDAQRAATPPKPRPQPVAVPSPEPTPCNCVLPVAPPQVVDPSHRATNYPR